MIRKKKINLRAIARRPTATPRVTKAKRLVEAAARPRVHHLLLLLHLQAPPLQLRKCLLRLTLLSKKK